jgi:hypothetical protein
MNILISIVVKEEEGIFDTIGRHLFGKKDWQREEEARYNRELLERERLQQQRAAEIRQQELLERKRAAAAALKQVERARENVRNAQLGLGTSHTQYQKGAQDLQAATAALAEVQAELKALKYENLTLVCGKIISC